MFRNGNLVDSEKRVTDVVDKETRSRMMSRIRGKNTKPELMMRRGLHSRGFRYLLHSPNLPGKPDMVFPKYRAAIFVHGCFWHVHNCKYFKFPGSRTEFWREKLLTNKQRDETVLLTLRTLDWRVLIIWECAIRNLKTQEDGEVLVGVVEQWLTGETAAAEIGIDGLIRPLVFPQNGRG